MSTKTKEEMKNDYLRDTLNDLIMETQSKEFFVAIAGVGPENFEAEKERLIEEYVERIKNELNVNKYTQ